MKKSLIVFVGLLTLVVFAGSVMAQGQTKPAAPAATEKQKATEPKSETAPQALKTSGTVAAYEAGKLIRVKDKDKEMAFELNADSKIKGDVKSGANVTVMYKKDGDRMVATDITMTVEKKAEEKKPASVEKKR